jgi:hypothetical protein
MKKLIILIVTVFLLTSCDKEVSGLCVVQEYQDYERVLVGNPTFYSITQEVVADYDISYLRKEGRVNLGMILDTEFPNRHKLVFTTDTVDKLIKHEEFLISPFNTPYLKRGEYCITLNTYEPCIR